MEWLGLIIIVGQLLLMGIVGVVGSLVVGLLKYLGKIKDGQSFIWIAWIDGIGIFLLEATRAVLPQLGWIYSSNINLDIVLNGLFWLLGILWALQLSLWTYSIIKNRLPVVGYSYSIQKE